MFKNDLDEGKVGEEIVKGFLEESGQFSSVRLIGSTLKKSKEHRDLQRKAGDIRCKRQDGSVVRFEVKRDKSANRTGNLFLERYSDNGSRTGKKTIGWFCNDEAQYDYYALVVVGKGTLFVKREELKDLVDTVKPRVLDMSYNQTQWNRSDGYIVKMTQVLSFCPSAKMVEGLY